MVLSWTMNSLKGKKGKIGQLKKQRLFLIVFCLQIGVFFFLFVSFPCYFVTYLFSNPFGIGRDYDNIKIRWFLHLFLIESAIPESLCRIPHSTLSLVSLCSLTLRARFQQLIINQSFQIPETPQEKKLNRTYFVIVCICIKLISPVMAF